MSQTEKVYCLGCFLGALMQMARIPGVWSWQENKSAGLLGCCQHSLFKTVRHQKLSGWPPLPGGGGLGRVVV